MNNQIVNSHKSLSTLLYHHILFEELIEVSQLNNNYGISKREIDKLRERYIEKYQLNKRDGKTKQEDEAANLRKVVTYENLKNQKFTIDTGNSFIFRENISSVLEDLKVNNFDIFQRTLSDIVLQEFTSKLNNFKMLFEKYLTFDERTRKDLIFDSIREMQKMNEALLSNSINISIAVENFILDEHNAKKSLKEKAAKAMELREKRVMPFQQFLFAGNEQNQKNKSISGIFEDIANYLEQYGFLSESSRVQFSASQVKDLGNSLTNDSLKLEKLTKSNKKRIAMMEYSKYYFEKMIKQLEEQRDYKSNRKGLAYVDVFDELIGLDVENTQLSSTLTNVNVESMKDLRDTDIAYIFEKEEDKELSQDEKDLINKQLKEKKNIILKKGQKEKFTKLIENRLKAIILSDTILNYFLNNKEADIYDYIKQDLFVIIEKNIGKGTADVFLTNNILSSMVGYYINYTNRKKGVDYKVIRHEKYGDNATKPIFKLFKRNK